jgi:hypothetical protein
MVATRHNSVQVAAKNVAVLEEGHTYQRTLPLYISQGDASQGSCHDYSTGLFRPDCLDCAKPLTEQIDLESRDDVPTKIKYSTVFNFERLKTLGSSCENRNYIGVAAGVAPLLPLLPLREAAEAAPLLPPPTAELS